jgi:fatty-acid peroxygenase
MADIPTLRSLDSTLALLGDPYRFISSRCRQLGSDIFQTRVLLRPTICISGRAAAELFYGSPHISRAGAAPMRIQKTLLGRGGIQGLDGAAHRHRKAMFLALVGPPRVEEIIAAVAAQWRAAVPRWSGRIDLYQEVRRVLMRAICAWSAVPLPEADVVRRTDEVAALFDAAGAVGPRHWAARLARGRCERWLGDLIADVRAGRLAVPAESALHAIATFRDVDGALPSPRIAAVELLNVLRPTVAVAVYVVMVAHALHTCPEARAWVAQGDGRRDECFAQEVRRAYPFFPAAIGRAAADFTWSGHPIARGRRILFDLYGTNHDARIWPDPEAFRPQRFVDWQPDAFALVPQGGGRHDLSHRCPGEWLTLGVMRLAVEQFARGLSYRVPAQDLDLDLARLPALPRSRMVLEDVRVAGVPPAGA